jgi:hypothetical protein
VNQELALKVLSQIMNWDIDRARSEDSWLRLMSRTKYDGYQDYLAGARFVESLANWLQQFDHDERETAYQFIRNHLVYIGPAEIQHLVDLVFPETIQPKIVTAVAQLLGIPEYMIWSHSEATKVYRLLLRKTLFLALSDGARIDAFRRANVGTISNEQIVLSTQIDDEKWEDLLKNLQKDLKDPAAKFCSVYLLDDFIASGKTLIREDDGIWNGKLFRSWTSTQKHIDTHFEENYIVHVHYYIASHDAKVEVPKRYEAALRRVGTENLFPRVKFSFGTVLPEDLPIDATRFPEFIKLTGKYYDPVIETKSIRVGRTDARLGFGKCALPLIIEHNTPNNSIGLLWAESEGTNGHPAMRPLFRRRQRHS